MNDYINQTIELGDYFKISIYKHHDSRYEIALQRGYKYLRQYDIAYDIMAEIYGADDVLTVHSPMHVYGAMNEIYTHLKNEYPSLMEDVEGWY